MALYLWMTRARVVRAGALAAGVLLAAIVVPTADTLWSRLYVSTPAHTIVAEDASGVVVLRDTPDGAGTHVMLSGIFQSWLPYGSIHTALGALPALLHPRPVRVAVIGLASGDTAFAIGGRPETETIDSIEIVRPQLAALTALDRQGRYPALRMLLSDPRVTHHIADGRAELRRHTGVYDIVEADALLPQHAHAGHLYSVEYFRLLGDRLAPGGFAVTWTPTERTRASLLQVFPHVLMFRTIAIGSRDPIAYERGVVEARLRSDFSHRYYAEGRVDVAGALAPLLADEPVRYGPDFDRRRLVDVNRDLFPQDEFARPYRGPSESLIAPILER
jgi:spermidine synthase